jgi:hypothetical protein
MKEVDVGIKTKYRRYIYVWRPWFAWYPVTIHTNVEGNQVCVTRAWWVWIERKRAAYYGGDEWEYRLKGD